MAQWLDTLQKMERYGIIEQHNGLKLVANGPPQSFVGERCEILDLNDHVVTQAEVVAFDKGKVFLLPFKHAPIKMGYKVRALGHHSKIKIGQALLGRVLNAFAEPIDRHSPLFGVSTFTSTENFIHPFARKAITEKIHTGVHIIDSVLPLGKGQRVGLFAGSGVGKTMLLSFLFKHVHSDVNVIAFIGERGREVQEFVESLDAVTLKKSIVVAACSDDSALMRRQAVYTAMSIAEFFCNQTKDVMLFMDSITRFAFAQREIGLSFGEPPTSRGYPPTTFSLLPSIVERAGNFANKGSITALFTVLVEGDDFNEPIADTMRALLDGHIVLTRELAERGHYPAIDVLQSVSRLSSSLLTEEELKLANHVRSIYNLYRSHQDLIEIGAYKPGNNPALDNAMKRIEALDSLFIQQHQHALSPPRLLERLQEILG